LKNPVTEPKRSQKPKRPLSAELQLIATALMEMLNSRPIQGAGHKSNKLFTIVSHIAAAAAAE
jgi:hypothetical protein